MADDVSGLSGAAGGAFFTSNAHLFSAAVNATNLSIGRQEARYAFGDTEGNKGAEAGGQSLAQWVELIAEMFPNLPENRIMVMAQQAVNDKEYASRILDHMSNQQSPVPNEGDVRTSQGYEPQTPESRLEKYEEDYQTRRIQDQNAKGAALEKRRRERLGMVEETLSPATQELAQTRAGGPVDSGNPIYAPTQGRMASGDRVTRQRASDLDYLESQGLLEGLSEQEVQSALNEIANQRRRRPAGY